jgi:hypothetical protein
MTLTDSQAKVVTGNNMAESSNVNVRVRQGNALLIILFSIVPDYIIKKLDIS